VLDELSRIGGEIESIQQRQGDTIDALGRQQTIARTAVRVRSRVPMTGVPSLPMIGLPSSSRTGTCTTRSLSKSTSAVAGLMLAIERLPNSRPSFSLCCDTSGRALS
jgi:hypothetical protein